LFPQFKKLIVFQVEENVSFFNLVFPLAEDAIASEPEHSMMWPLIKGEGFYFIALWDAIDMMETYYWFD